MLRIKGIRILWQLVVLTTISNKVENKLHTPKEKFTHLILPLTQLQPFEVDEQHQTSTPSHLGKGQRTQCFISFLHSCLLHPLFTNKRKPPPSCPFYMFPLCSSLGFLQLSILPTKCGNQFQVVRHLPTRGFAAGKDSKA